MKVGSLVECIIYSTGKSKIHGQILRDRPVGYVGVVTSVELDHFGDDGILVDDDPFVPHPVRGFWHRHADYWREIQPPIDISEMVKESINEPA